MGKDWDRIGIRLGLGREMSGIREDFHGQFTRAWEVLQSWKQYRGNDATVKELYLTLLRCRRKDLAGMWVDTQTANLFDNNPVLSPGRLVHSNTDAHLYTLGPCGPCIGTIRVSFVVIDRRYRFFSIH